MSQLVPDDLRSQIVEDGEASDHLKACAKHLLEHDKNFTSAYHHMRSVEKGANSSEVEAAETEVVKSYVGLLEIRERLIKLLQDEGRTVPWQLRMRVKELDAVMEKNTKGANQQKDVESKRSRILHQPHASQLDVPTTAFLAQQHINRQLVIRLGLLSILTCLGVFLYEKAH